MHFLKDGLFITTFTSLQGLAWCLAHPESTLAKWIENHVKQFLLQNANSFSQVGQAPSGCLGRHDISIYEAVHPGLGLAPD